MTRDDEDNLDEGDDDALEEDDEPEIPPPPPSEPRPTAPAQKPRRPRGSSKAAGLGAAAPFESHLAVDLVGEILERLEKFPGLGNPWDYNVQVLTMDGRDRHQSDRILGSFSLYRIQGNRAPGDALQEIVTNQYHFPRTEAPDTYDIRFIRAKTGKLFARAKLSLGSREEILAIQRSQQEAERNRPPPPAPPQGSWTGYGAPQYPPPPPYPAPQASAADDNDIRFLRSELQRTQGMLEEALRAAREGRQPPPSLGAPPPAPARAESEDERIARIVAQTLRSMGIGPAAGMGAAPAPAPPPAAAAPTMADKFQSMMNRGFESMLTGVAEKALSHVGKTIENALNATTSPPAEVEDPEDPDPPPPPPPDPMDKLPFELVPAKGLDGTPVKWTDGSPLMVGLDRETGDFSLKGSLIGNPFVAGQGMKIAQTLGEAAKAAASRVQFPDGSSVVDRTPRGARDAGVGAQPERPQPPKQEPPPPPPAPPAPRPNGAAGGGGFPVM